MARTVTRLELRFHTKWLGLGFIRLMALPMVIFGDYPKPVARAICKLGYRLMGPTISEA